MRPSSPLTHFAPIEVRNGSGVNQHEADNTSQYQQLKNWLAAIHALGQELTLLHDETTIIYRVLETAAKALHFDFATVGLVEETNQKLLYRYGMMGDRLISIHWQLSLEAERSPYIGVTVACTGQSLNLARVTDTPRYVFLRPGQIGHSELCVPLKVGQKIIGVLHVEHAATAFFTDEDQQLLQILADQTAVALENARLYTEAQKRTQVLKILRELDQALTTSLFIEDVFEATAYHTARLLAYDQMSIVQVDGEHLKLIYQTSIDEDRSFVEDTHPLQDSVVAWVLEHGHILLGHPSSELDYAPDEWPMAVGIQASLIIPLYVKGNIIGTWHFGSRQMGTYAADDLTIAQAIAAQLSIAIENAHLYHSLHQQMQVLQDTQAQLVESEKIAAIGQLSATIVHEINNPLQAIKNALHLVKQALNKGGGDHEEIDYSFSIVDNEIRRISNIMDRMRRYYRSLNQELTLLPTDLAAIEQFLQSSPHEWQLLAVRPLLEYALQLANQQLQDQHVIVKTHWGPNLPLLQGNPNHLKQVFLNLLLNAMETMQECGGTLRVSAVSDQVLLAGDGYAPVIRIEISDTGQGISPENLSSIFKPYFTTKKQGVGLGLFICSKIIESHQGQISVESRVGLGTIFTILLPAEPSAKLSSLPQLPLPQGVDISSREMSVSNLSMQI
jgi:signal transduction histidine kinase